MFHNLEHQFQLVDVYDFYKMCPIHGTLAQIASQLVVDSNSYLQARIYTSQVQDVFHEHHLDFLLRSLWGDLGCDCQSSRLTSGVLHHGRE